MILSVETFMVDCAVVDLNLNSNEVTSITGDLVLYA